MLSKSQQTIITILQQLRAGSSNTAIAAKLNELQLTTPRGLAYSCNAIEQDIWKLRNPAEHFKSTLYQELLLLIVSGQLTLKDAFTALYQSPRLSGK
ncbi:MAG: hypothetical protein Q7T66_04760 [Herminiimonas sp.]|uniref:hypothetical protein n=1 Tax=Herminiimonas sp. TaxID=1926289 RepID=UPI00271DA3A3|nr:hypothetical protein [Herminiimonas sp.]MDO9419956.1 hypothetical protein [Herminiimonas sp.]